MRAAEETEIRRNIEAQGLMSYNERLLEEYRNSSNEEHIVSTSFVSLFSNSVEDEEAHHVLIESVNPAFIAYTPSQCVSRS